MTLQRASLTKRLLAALVDSILVSVVSLVPVVGAVAGLIYALSKDSLIFSLTGDARWKNMSIGKRVMEIRVVKTDGSDITVGDSVRRNLILSLGSIMGIVPVIGWIMGSVLALAAAVLETVLVLTDPQGRRLGDRLAGTIVVEGTSLRMT